MLLKILLLLICGLSFVKSVPPLQQREEITVSDLFRRQNKTINSRALNYLLPTNIKPEHYTVNIRPILDGGPRQFEAPGDVTIRVKCIEATNAITLHSIQILINEGSVKVTDVESGAEILITGHGNNEEDETYTVTLESELVPQKLYNLYIPFTATVLLELRGLYRSKYTDSEGNERWLATTQFEGMDARRAFPCFDEPAMKATFDMNIAFNEPAGYHALCNMDILETTDDSDPEFPGWKWSKYRTSVVMPTYLIAIVVSDFISEAAPPGSFGDKPVKTWGQRDLMSKDKSGEYAAITTAKDLVFYQDYFDQDYELPKMDSVAIPDFPYGAMENWGLITYKVGYLLYFAGETTEASRRRITSVIAHEVAHQWFGNIVTMQFWNDIWLNEGLSTYAERLAHSQSDPEFDGLNTDAIAAVQTSMAFDIGPGTYPVSNEIENPSQIIYEKGSSLIRMLNAVLTEETLKRGLRNYIKEKLYGNAVQDDLFRVLNDVAQEDGNLPNLNVKEIMDTWTLQTGYPLIRVSKASSTKIFISQERFKYQRLVTTIDPNELWWVPVTYTSANTPTLPNYKPKLWIPKTIILTSHTVDINLNTDWIFVNPSGYGFYRVLYDPSLSVLIKSQLDRDASVFTSTSRSQLLDDYFTMAYNDYISIERALEFTTYLGQESSFIAWNPVIKHLDTAYRLFSGTESDFAALKEFFSEKLEQALVLIGPEQSPEDKGDNVMLRANLLNWACGMGTETCRAYGAKLYAQWMETPETNPIPTDLKNIMQCAGVYLGGEEEMAFAKDQFRSSDANSDNRKMWLNAIACSSDSDELTTLLSSAFQNEDFFTKGEAVTFFKAMAANSAGRNAAFYFLEQQLTAILAYLNGDTIVVEGVFETLAQYFNKEEHAARMSAFVEANSLILPVGRLNDHIRTVRLNVDWMSKYGNDAVNWFNSNLRAP